MKTLSGIYATELVKQTYEMDAIHINGKLSSTGAKWLESCFISVFDFAAFQPRI